MKYASEQFSGVMQVQGLLYVAIGLTGGSLIRIEFEHTGDNNFHDLRTQVAYSQRSLLGAHPIPYSKFYTIRDSLSLVSCSSSGWATSGRSHGVIQCDCCRQTVPLSSSGRASSDSCGLQSEFLGADSLHLLRIFGNGGDDGTMYAVASTPTPSYSPSGGYFQLVATNSNQMRVVHTVERSAANTHGHLQDVVLNDDFLCMLLERQGFSMAERTTLYLAMPSASHGATLETDTYGEDLDLT
ncbi:hypothetical protein M405DRAFT_50364 [Rhizopogon salebrosus TDB-379]|nr:hypothetical protein M405DRAFT_50364 [Rhizopogon salebrosus TDB-379]